MKLGLLALSVLMFSTVTLAASKFEHTPVKFDPAAFTEQRENLIDEIRTGERYRELSEENTDKVLKALNAMADLLEGVSSLDQLPAAKKVALFNHQEVVNNLLTEAAADSRLICTREKPIGSNRPINTCKTVAQRRLETQRSQDFMRSIKTEPVPIRN